MRDNKNLRQQTFSLKDVAHLRPCNREKLTEWLARYPNSEVAITPALIRRAADARLLNPWWFTSLFLTPEALDEWVALCWTLGERGYWVQWFILASDNMTPEQLEELRVLSGADSLAQFAGAEARLRAELAARVLMEIIKEGDARYATEQISQATNPDAG